MKIERCAAGEDFQYLAFCALAEDFTTLVDGVVRPEHLSDVGGVIAEWVLGLRNRPSHPFPPTYDALQLQFPQVEWPAVARTRGLDPMYAATQVLYSYKTWQSTQLLGLAQDLADAPLDDAKLTLALEQVEQRLASLRGLGSPRKEIMRVGDDVQQLREMFRGKGTSEQINHFECHLPDIEAMCSPWTRGLYSFFGRPKSGKSFTLLYSAMRHCIHQGFRGLYVDQENDLSTLLTRLACAVAQVDLQRALSVQAKGRHNLPLSHEEVLTLAALDEAAEIIHATSGLRLLTKEHIDPEAGFITVERIFEEAEKHGIDVLFVEQTHKIGLLTGIRRGDNEVTRVHRVTQRLADSPYLVLATTQEKRSNEKRKEDKSRYQAPTDDLVFGGDAVAQNCAGLVHVRKFELSDSTSMLQCYTPLSSRNGRLPAPFFVRTVPCTSLEVLDYSEGLALAEASIQRTQNLRTAAMERGKQMAKDTGAPPATPAWQQKTGAPAEALAAVRLFGAKLP